MSRLLIDEYPLLVLPSLAIIIGLNEAITLQQMHYWLDPRINKNLRSGLHWVYNSYEEWQKQFPFWSIRTIRRNIQSLEEQNLLISKNFNSNSFDKTKWYSINYNTLNIITTRNSPSVQFDHIDTDNSSLSINPTYASSIRSNCPYEKDKMDNSNKRTKTTTKITTENSLSLSQQPEIKNTQNEPKGNEREKEMLNIWDKIIREEEKPSVHSQSRLLALKKVLEDYFENNLENWKNYCLNIKKSNFLMGGGPNNWKADLTWAISQENLIRVLEGYYHQKEGKTLENYKEEFGEEAEEICDDAIWNAVKEILKIKRGESTYKSWFKKLSLKGYEGNRVLLFASTKFIKEWIMSNYHRDIIDSFKQANFQIEELEIFIKDGEGSLVV
jgi:hypothetical protein